MFSLTKKKTEIVMRDEPNYRTHYGKKLRQYFGKIVQLFV